MKRRKYRMKKAAALVLAGILGLSPLMAYGQEAGAADSTDNGQQTKEAEAGQMPDVSQDNAEREEEHTPVSEASQNNAEQVEELPQPSESGMETLSEIIKPEQEWDRGRQADNTRHGTYLAAPDEPAVVNFKSVLGKKSQNLGQMKKYIKKASQMGVKFREYKMILKQAETTGGRTAKAVSSLAVSNQMWIVYGAPEKINGDKKHAYNSAFLCDPQGNVHTCRKTKS